MLSKESSISSVGADADACIEKLKSCVNEFFVNDTAIKNNAHFKEAKLLRGVWDKVFNLIDRLPTKEDLKARNGEIKINVSSDVISIGDSKDLDSSELKLLNEVIASLSPWRKGPFNLFGAEIEAEWRSDFKWNRISNELSDIAGKTVLDIGCGNGYYMFRASSLNPSCVVGIDPSEQFWLSFKLMQKFICDERLHYLLCGAEDLSIFPETFDVALCMGVLYHQRNPFLLLQLIFNSLVSGGKVIVESQTIPSPKILGYESVALLPEDRYAQMRNVYFVPTIECLVNLVKRSGFVNVKVISDSELTSKEQRVTPLGPKQSLSDFLHPTKVGLTIDDYPAPRRAAVCGFKP